MANNKDIGGFLDSYFGNNQNKDDDDKPTLIGLVISSGLLSDLFSAPDYTMGNGWKGWDALDSKGNAPKGWQCMSHINQINNYTGIRLEEAKQDISGYLNNVGMESFFNLYIQAKSTHPNYAVLYKAKSFYDYYKIIGKEEDGKKVANAFSKISGETLQFPEIEKKQSATQNTTTKNNQNNNININKKNKWIIPVLIGVTSISLIGGLYFYFKNKN